MKLSLGGCNEAGALGAVLIDGAVPIEDLGEFFGVERWPEEVPVQVHYATGDPWVEAEGEVAPLGEAVRGAAFEEHTYPGSGHLFLPTRTGPSTIVRRPRRCRSGCSPS